MERLIPLEKACALLGAYPSPVRAWEEKGRIRVVYTVGGKRQSPEAESARLTGTMPPSQDGLLALYARVSSHEHRVMGELDRQAQALGLRSQAKACALVQAVQSVVTG